MKFNYANSPLTAALIRKYEYERDQAIANLNVYFTNPAGIGEHGDIVSQMDDQVNKLAVAEGNLKTVIATFVNIPQQAPSGAPEATEES